jgi:hypothetical protein
MSNGNGVARERRRRRGDTKYRPTAALQDAGGGLTGEITHHPPDQATVMGRGIPAEKHRRAGNSNEYEKKLPRIPTRFRAGART